MPPKQTKVQQQRRKPSVTGTFSYNGAPFTFPGTGDKPTAKDIVNHIRICPDVTLSRTRKLINAAIRANCLHITIGLPPPKAYVEAAANPTYYYEGSDIMQLEPLLATKHTMLECTATVCVGDGGEDVEDDSDAENATHYIQKGYREPSLSLFF